MCYHICGELLPHRFTLTSGFPLGGLFSVALSVTRRLTASCPGVTWQCVHGARTFLGIVPLGYYFATVQPVALPQSNVVRQLSVVESMSAMMPQ